MSIKSVINDTLSSDSIINAQKPLPPTISGYSVGGLDDTALDPAGGQTVQINGTGFLPGATITFDGSAVSVVTFTNPNQLTFTSPAKSAGTYTIYVVNPDSGTAIYIPGVIYSSLPTWTTGAGTLGSYYETTSISNTVVASGDAPITYSLYSGSLPTGSTLSSSGVITGTAPVDSSSTTYSFTIEALDAQLQSSTRSFSLTINTDVVTWITPESNATYTLSANSAISNVTLSATDAAGYGIVYTANSLPTGLSLSGNTISGTPTVVADSSTLLTATANTTNRTSTRTINWSVTVANDQYFEYNTLLIPGASTTFVDDASTNNFAVTIAGDTKPNSMNPYSLGYYSGYFDGTGDYLTLPDNTAFDFPGDFTIEAWVYLNTVTGSQGVYSSIDNGADSWVGVTLSFSGTSFLATSYISGNDTITHQTAVTAGQWYHIAIVRNGSSTKSYLNGVQSTSTTSGTYSLTQSGGTIGSAYPGSSPLNGYISNLRVVKGTAVYTSSFTPSTSPLTAISGTSLLTCQSNRFIDNSTNAFSLTVTGDTKIQSFQPFTPNTSYSTYGSGYFDGTGDYLSLAGINLGSGDFTIEGWIYPTNSAAGAAQVIYCSTGGGSQSRVTLQLSTSMVLQSYIRNSDATNIVTYSGSGAVPVNTWSHVAVVRNSGNIYLYVNGTLNNTPASSTQNISTNATATYIGSVSTSAQLFFGNICDLRVNTTAVYTTAFTPPTSPLTAISGTSLLTLQNNQSVNNSTFLDNSSNNFLITRVGNTIQGTFSPYGSNWSNYFDGTGDYLSLPSSVFLNAGTGDYTWECWCYPITVGNSNYGSIISSYPTSGYFYVQFSNASTQLIFSFDGTEKISTTSLQLSTWNHIAVSRASGVVRTFINGVVQHTVTTSYSTTFSGALIGASGSTPNYMWYGYQSNHRLIVGTGIYTGAFTPPTAPLTAVSGTQLLTCQSNRFIDNSTNAFTITKNGDTSIQRFSPFNPTGPGYATTTIGGSAYFDGTGNYLNVPANTVFAPTGDFSIMFWCYISPTASGYIHPMGNYTSNVTSDWMFEINMPSGTLYVYNSGGATQVNSSGTIKAGQWAHLAMIRSGTTVTAYLNGVNIGTRTQSGTFGSASKVITIGGTGSVGDFFGYISDVTFVSGTALYTSNFVPPSQPLTAVQNTVLLNSMTSAGIYDAAMMNDMGSVGDAKLSTAVSKFGGSSMYFDGTGDYLSMPSTQLMNFGTGDFTVETWVNPTALSGDCFIISATGSGGFFVGYSSTTTLGWGWGRNGIAWDYRVASTATTGTWQHLAITRSGTSMRMFVNGTQVGTTQTISTAYDMGVTSTTVGSQGAAYYLNGYLDDLRITKGYARYTTNFTAPTSAFPTY